MDAAAARQETPKTLINSSTRPQRALARLPRHGRFDAARDLPARPLRRTPRTKLGDLCAEDFAALSPRLLDWRAERACDEQCVRIRRGVGMGAGSSTATSWRSPGRTCRSWSTRSWANWRTSALPRSPCFTPLAPSAKGEGRDSLIPIHLPRCRRRRARTCSMRARVAGRRSLRSRRFPGHAPAHAELRRGAEKAKTNAPPEEVAEAVALLLLARGRQIHLHRRARLSLRALRQGRADAHEPEILEKTCLGCFAMWSATFCAPRRNRWFSRPN